MAATLTLDTLKGMELIYGGEGTNFVRTGVIRDIPTGDDYKLLFDARDVTGMPAEGDALDATDYPELVLRRIKLNPLGPSVCGVELVYQTPTLQFGGFSAWVIRKSARVSQTETSVVPGEGSAINIGFSGTISSVTRAIRARPQRMTFPLPVQEISATAIVLGSPTDDISEWVGYVNENTFYGRPPGHWLVTDGGSEVSVYSGYYTVFATVVARPGQDWSEYQFLQDPITGDVLYNTTDYATAQALDYAHGIINATPSTSGFARVGPHPMAPLETVLDF